MPDNLYRRGRVWWGRIQVASTERRRSLRTTDRAEARRRFQAWAKELQGAAHFAERRMTWLAAVSRCMSEVFPHSLKPGALQRYKVSLKQLDGHFRNKYLDEITRRDVATYVGKRAGVSNATKRRDLTAASQVFEAAAAWGACDHNPFLEFNRKTIRERREPIRPPDPGSVALVIARMPDRLADMVRFLYLTGCRQEEAASLEWPQVDLQRGEILLTKTKTNRPRRITIDAATVALLSKLPRSIKSPVVFYHGNGERYRNVASRFRAIVAAVAQSAQKSAQPFRRFRCHDLRHGYAIRELQQGRDIYDLSRHLGHRSVKTTEVYLAYIRTDESAQNPAQWRRFAGNGAVSDGERK